MSAMAQKRDRPGILKLPWLLTFFYLIACLLWPMSMQAADTLTNATAVLALSADEASSGIPVSVTGVVTAAETNWTGARGAMRGGQR